MSRKNMGNKGSGAREVKDSTVGNGKQNEWESNNL